jgi:hypothetical protein
MGENIIDIAAKSVFGLLVDEVLHPFYVFQIASIVLWSLDDYYYYAFAIGVISISSILGTLFETKRTVERMREMSRFHCDVRVLVDHECKPLLGACVTLAQGLINRGHDGLLQPCPGGYLRLVRSRPCRFPMRRSAPLWRRYRQRIDAHWRIGPCIQSSRQGRLATDHVT